MYKRFEDVKSIRFPVYSIPDNNWYIQDKVLFSSSGKVIDDANMPGETIGIRRIQCGRKDLCRIRRTFIDFQSMLSAKSRYFVDSKGTPFEYLKTINSPLIHHKVDRIELKETHTLIWLKLIPYPFKLPRPPYGDAVWARVLYYRGCPWLIYDFSSTKGKDTYKRV